MHSVSPNDSSPEPQNHEERPVSRPAGLRLWPGKLILGLQLVTLVISVTPAIQNVVRFGFMMLGPLVCLLLFLGWLLLFSRLTWKERLLIPVLLGAGAAVAGRLMDPSMGVPLWIYGVPLVMTAVVTGLQFRHRSSPASRTGLAVLLGSLVWCVIPLLRLNGFTGDYAPELAWRWSPNREDQLARAAVTPDANTGESPSSTLGEPGPEDWPQFRGAQLDSRAGGLAAPLDWRESPPRILWKGPIGPGWSSFSSVANRLFTQEQRGEFELVTCLDADSGKPLWQSEHPTRFSDVVAGAGPRATPTYHAGKLFTYGAKALLTSLDATSGRVLWQRDLMAELKAQLPVWGFSNSPVVVGDAVIVYAGGEGDQGLVAYHAETGEPLWQRPQQGMNFGTAQPVQLAGENLVLFSSPDGLEALSPQTGEVAWRTTPTNWRGPLMCQPQQIGPQSLIVPLGDGVGVARLEVEKAGEDWDVREAWTSTQLKPSFNDFVHHAGYLYGFDQNIFACVDAATGRRRWKQGRYGFGQVILLPDADRLIVLTEQGDVVLLATDPTAHQELGRLSAIEGKTWNHPCIAGGRLFVRNGSEAAAIALTDSAVEPSPETEPTDSAP